MLISETNGGNNGGHGCNKGCNNVLKVHFKLSSYAWPSNNSKLTHNELTFNFIVSIHLVLYALISDLDIIVGNE